MLTEYDISSEEFDENHVVQFLEGLGGMHGVEIYKWSVVPHDNPFYVSKLRILGYRKKEEHV